MALEQAFALIAQVSTRAPVPLSRITKLTFGNAADCRALPPEAAASPRVPANKHPLRLKPHYVYAQLVQLIAQVHHTRNGVLDACAAASMKLEELNTAPQHTENPVWAKELETEIAVLKGRLKDENELLEAMEDMRAELQQSWRAVTEKGCAAEPDIWVQDLNEGGLREPFGLE